MTDNELVLAMSGLLDKKLKPLNDRMERIETTIEDNVLPRLERIETTIEDNVLPRIERIESTMEQMETTIEDDILPRMKRMELTVENDILPRMKRMELTVENNILPRMQNIESCYISTYKRYQVGCEQMDAMESDMEIMKQVIMEHSERLQKIS